jgi:hypothetical protein
MIDGSKLISTRVGSMSFTHIVVIIFHWLQMYLDNKYTGMLLTANQYVIMKYER